MICAQWTEYLMGWQIICSVPPVFSDTWRPTGDAPCSLGTPASGPPGSGRCRSSYRCSSRLRHCSLETWAPWQPPPFRRGKRVPSEVFSTSRGPGSQEDSRRWRCWGWGGRSRPSCWRPSSSSTGAWPRTWSRCPGCRTWPPAWSCPGRRCASQRTSSSSSSCPASRWSSRPRRTAPCRAPRCPHCPLPPGTPEQAWALDSPRWSICWLASSSRPRLCQLPSLPALLQTTTLNLMTFLNFHNVFTFWLQHDEYTVGWPCLVKQQHFKCNQWLLISHPLLTIQTTRPDMWIIFLVLICSPITRRVATIILIVSRWWRSVRCCPILPPAWHWGGAAH